MSFVDRYENQLITAASRQHAHAARRRRWRMPAIGFGGLAVIGATAAAALVLIPAGSKLSPVQEALAALGTPNQILHFKVAPVLPPDYGSCRPGDPEEMWQTTADRPRIRQIHTPPVGTDCGPLPRAADETPLYGRYETAYDRGVESTYVPALSRVVHVVDAEAPIALKLDLSPAGDGAWISDRATPETQQEALRALLTEPGLRDEGVSEQEGRRVRTFVLPEGKVKDDYPDRPKDGTITYVVDAESFAPISVVKRYAINISTARGKTKFVKTTEGFTFALWELLPLTASSERLLRIQLPPGTSAARGTADHFYQAPRPVRLKRQEQGDARLAAYLKRTSGQNTTP